MTKAVTAGHLDFATKGIPAAVLEPLMHPETDPSLELPAWATAENAPDATVSGLPSIEELEAALIAHVRGEASPKKMIECMLEPFSQVGYLDLLPGQGLKRPSYEIKIQPYGLHIGRSNPRIVAERLHEIATGIARQKVGNRASAEDPVILIETPFSSAQNIEFPAPNVTAARAAYRAISGRAPQAVYVPLPFTAEKLFPHALAAREIIEAKAAGSIQYRQQALDLIRATQDLRAVATVELRSQENFRPYNTHWITLRLGPSSAVEVTDERSAKQTAHEHIEFAAKHQQLKKSLIATAKRHPVLRKFPEDFVLTLSGEPSYLDITIKDETKNIGDAGASMSSLLFEYSKLKELEEHLAWFDNPPAARKARWNLVLHNSYRSKMSWDLSGPTFANALANELEESYNRASMNLIDLLIDLIANNSGEKCEMTLYRVLEG